MASVATWIPFVRASAIGWIPIARNPIQPLPQPLRGTPNAVAAAAPTTAASRRSRMRTLTPSPPRLTTASAAGDDGSTTAAAAVGGIVDDDGRVKINVGGRQFVTYGQTLARFPDTLLGSDEREYFYDPDVGEYFFDRDPMLFGRVLSYYRTGRVHWPRTECVAAFNDELAFFGIRAGDAVAECCMVM